MGESIGMVHMAQKKHWSAMISTGSLWGIHGLSKPVSQAPGLARKISSIWDPWTAETDGVRKMWDWLFDTVLEKYMDMHVFVIVCIYPHNSMFYMYMHVIVTEQVCFTEQMWTFPWHVRLVEMNSAWRLPQQTGKNMTGVLDCPLFDSIVSLLT